MHVCRLATYHVVLEMNQIYFTDLGEKRQSTCNLASIFRGDVMNAIDDSLGVSHTYVLLRQDLLS